MAEMTRSRLDDYEIIKKIGEGGYAKVKIGQAASGQPVALKILRKDFSDMNGHFLQQTRREIEALKRLDHPNIIKILDVNETGIYRSRTKGELQRFYIAMELVTNGELFDLIAGQREAMGEPVARAIFKQLISAVDACHRQGIFHRDIKPENVLFDSHFQLKLADFGWSASVSNSGYSGYLSTKAGTDSYMSPEILTGQSYSGASVDVFASGIVLFLLMTGRPMFHLASLRDRSYHAFLTTNELYWTNIARSFPPGRFSADFKHLINGMLAFSAESRLTLGDVSRHPWVAGPEATREEVEKELGDRYLISHFHPPASGAVNNPTGRYRGDLGESQEGGSDITLLQYQNQMSKSFLIETELSASLSMRLIQTCFRDKEAEITLVPGKYKVKAKLTTGEGDEIRPVQLSIELFLAANGLIYVEATKTQGSTYDFLTVFLSLKDVFSNAETLRSS